MRNRKSYKLDLKNLSVRIKPPENPEDMYRLVIDSTGEISMFEMYQVYEFFQEVFDSEHAAMRLIRSKE